MINAGLIGLGGMGRGHLENLVRMNREGYVSLKAACDFDPAKFANMESTLNIKGVGESQFDFDSFNHYTSIDDMIANEKLDLIVIAIPTYLHADAAIKCLDAGINVMCEKPMALTSDDCNRMIAAAEKNGKYLMIGQVLRFWGEYQVLKALIEDAKTDDPAKKTYKDIDLGKPLCGYFFRGGAVPTGSWQNWYWDKNKSGGCIQDQHIHDVDMINWLFGMPKAVCSRGANMLKTRGFDSGYDAVTTTYIYDDDIAINSQDDWSMDGRDFWMEFRISFERGTFIMGSNNGGVMIKSHDGKDLTPEIDTENAYYKEVLYLVNLVKNNGVNTVNPPTDSRDTIRIVEAEVKSCDNNGAIVEVK
ncbi:MAG: Gfo/Idh/MocA family protein [Eubacteriales bacterium]|jgi:predicted dehydrogenase